MGLMSRLSFSGKSFLNTAEYLDPVTDEWTTFIPVDAIDFPEKPDADGDADVKVDADQEVEVSAATSNDVLSSASPSKSVTPVDVDDEVPDLEEVNQTEASGSSQADVIGVETNGVVETDADGVIETNGVVETDASDVDTNVNADAAPSNEWHSRKVDIPSEADLYHDDKKSNDSDATFCICT